MPGGAALLPIVAALLELLRCPTCRGRLHPDDGTLRCPAGHTFDIARHGYVSLLTGNRAISGDDAAMARARERFLSTGSYAPVRRAVGRLAAGADPEPGTVLEVGCGTGYYLADVLDRLPAARGLGLDSSVRALRSAARAHDRAAAASWDVVRPLPLTDGVADVVLDVFAPRNPSEFHRVLRPNGRLIVVRPTAQHLHELRAHVPGMVKVDPHKEQRLHRVLDPFFEPIAVRPVEYLLPLSRSEAIDLVAMTPSGRHVSRGELEAAGPPSGQVTVSVLATAYRPRG